MDIQIDEEFKNLIPPLQKAEYTQLEANIIEEGCRDPIVIWDNIIIDGHNRYKICTDNNIKFKTQKVEFGSREDAEIWMINLQYGRRNLTPKTRASLALKKKSILAEVAKKNNIVGGGFDNIVEALDTRETLAKEAGVSEGTLNKVEHIEKDGTEALNEALNKSDCDISISLAEKVSKESEEIQEEFLAKVEEGVKPTQALKDIKIDAFNKDIEKQKEAILEGTLVLPEGKYEAIAIDPPWNYGREYDPETSRVANPYPEMKQEELLELDIPSADDSAMFLWTTHAFIFDAKELLDKWGFEYKATMVWNKEKIGMGHWLRMQCEFCLVGIKGKPKWNNTTWRDIINEGRREHSRKPEAFYKMVDDVVTGRKLEYFSRTARDGWEVFGNDIGRLS